MTEPEVIKKWETILAMDEPRGITYSRNVLIEMLSDFKQLNKHDVSGERLSFGERLKEVELRLHERLDEVIKGWEAACASGAVDTVAARRVKYCEWCQLETPIENDKCSECGKPCAEVL